MYNSKHRWLITFDADHSPGGWVNWIADELTELRSRNFDVIRLANKIQMGVVRYTVSHPSPHAMLLYQLSGERRILVQVDA